MIASSPSAKASPSSSSTSCSANHKAPTGDQTFTLTAAKIKFHHDVGSASPTAGSGVKLHGRITALARHCPTEGFTPTITVRKVDISKAGHHKG
jgi:hypothetical protein